MLCLLLLQFCNFLFSNKTKNYNADDVQPYSYIDLAHFVSMTADPIGPK